MIASQKVLDALKAIGLNLYERKLWVALLARGTATAGELSEITKVPRSRTYDILESLADKGFVIIQNAKPLRYVAVPPEEALERWKKRYEEKVREMQERIDNMIKSDVFTELKKLHQKGLKIVAPEELTGTLRGKFSVMNHLASLIKNANRSVDIFASPEALMEIYRNHLDLLFKAKERGVKIRIATTKISDPDVLKTLASLGEVKVVDEKQLPIEGKLAIVDDTHLVLGLTDFKNVHESQLLAVWSRSQYAASKMFKPMFEAIWKSGKNI